MRKARMSDKRIGEFSFWWFVLSTFTLLGLALLIFVPLSKTMKTVNEPGELQRKIETLEQHVRDIDELKGRVGTIENSSAATQRQPQQKAQNDNDGHSLARKKQTQNSKPEH